MNNIQIPHDIRKEERKQQNATKNTHVMTDDATINKTLKKIKESFDRNDRGPIKYIVPGERKITDSLQITY